MEDVRSKRPGPHPDFIAIAPSGRSAGVFLENGEHHLISLLLVTGVGTESRDSA